MINDLQQSLLAFDEPPATAFAAPAPNSSRPSAPKDWIAAAVESCFSSQKKRWTAMAQMRREQVIDAMWAYSLARHESTAAPLLAVEAEAAIFNWLNTQPDLAAVISVLNANFVTPAEIPPPVLS